jgi:hypothetical protein
MHHVILLFDNIILLFERINDFRRHFVSLDE